LNLHVYAPNPIQWIDPWGLVKTKTDLYAFGNSVAPREPRIGMDIFPDDSGVIAPSKTGASTFGDVNKAPLTGTYYKLPEGTELPDGMDVIADGTDVGGDQPETHHTLCNTKPIPADEFKDKFNKLPWQKSGKKK
jgi:hypothetical protein